MISRLIIYKADGFNPYENLAKEKFLLDTADENSLILYLWQNENTVVIGKNQNPWAECNCTLLENEGGFVARRLSGGGAVFHDKGNLNFTFISTAENYNQDKNFEIIKTACEYAGITAEVSGRNDVLVGDKKFSGNAFYHAKGKAYHHGTILISSSPEKIERYLTPSREKLEAKGVKSVKSRVVNLSELNPDLTPEIMAEYMEKAAQNELDLAAEILPNIAQEHIENDAELFGSWDYIYGKTLPFSFKTSRRLDFGNTEININSKNGKIDDIKVYTDAMDFTLSEKIESALRGCEFKTDEIEAKLKSCLPDDYATQIANMLKDE